MFARVLTCFVNKNKDTKNRRLAGIKMKTQSRRTKENKGTRKQGETGWNQRRVDQKKEETAEEENREAEKNIEDGR